MPSVAKRVHAILEEDMFLLEALSRGIVKYRGLARWLVNERGIEANEETIVSALRRFDPDDPWDLKPAKEVLAGAHVNTRSGVTALVLDRELVCDRVEEIVSAVDIRHRERIRIVQAGDRITVVVDDRNLDDVQDVLKGGLVAETVPDLAELEVVAPADGVETPGVMGMLFAALSVRNVSVSFVMSGYPEQLVFVPKEDLFDAYEAVEGLIASCDSKS